MKTNRIFPWVIIPALLGFVGPWAALVNRPGRGADQALDGIIDGIGLIAGGIVIWMGFRKLHVRLLMEATPTAHIRSVAMGLAEIAGMARAKYDLLTAPCSGTRCLFFRHLVEKRVQSRNGSHWQKISENMSSTYFYVEDATGRLLVDPMNADLNLKRDFCSVGPDDLFLPAVRHSEWHILPGDYIYALGTVQKLVTANPTREDRLREKLRVLKADADAMSRIDTNGDGTVSTREWDEARAILEQDALREELARAPETNDDIVMAKGAEETTYLLSDRDERELAGRYGWAGGGLIALGCLLMLVCAWSALARAGSLPAASAIPWHVMIQ